MATARKLASLDQLKAKRAESVGSEECFPWEASDSLTLQIKDPRIADVEWRDELAILRTQLEDGEILPSEFRDEMLELYLGEEHTGVVGQVEAFTEAGGTSEILGEVIESWVEQSDPTRTSSRSTRRQSKRR
ncbi:MAG: hypothetical protein ACK4M5_00310 [Dietzia cercidiphylli]